MTEAPKITQLNPIAEVEVSSDDGEGANIQDNIAEGYQSQMARLGEGDHFEDEDAERIR